MGDGARPTWAWLALMLAVALVPLDPALAQGTNPHTSDGRACGPWLASAPLSERIRQIESCKRLEIGKVMRLAEEYENGSNGMPRDWQQAARWLRDAIRRADAMSRESYGARRGEDAQARLVRLLLTGGPGLPVDVDEAERVARLWAEPNLRPGRWEVSTRYERDQRDIPERATREMMCFDAKAMREQSPFSMSREIRDVRAAGCKISRMRMHPADAGLVFSCSSSQTKGAYLSGDMAMTFQGDAATAVWSARDADGKLGRFSRTGRRLGDC